jgi:hypothetical protein
MPIGSDRPMNGKRRETCATRMGCVGHGSPGGPFALNVIDTLRSPRRHRSWPLRFGTWHGRADDRLARRTLSLQTQLA